MNYKKLHQYILPFFWIIGMGCGALSPTAIPTVSETPKQTQFVPTQTPIPPTPTNTPEPVIDLSWAAAHPEDLPDSNAFELPLNMISITSYDMLGANFSNQQVFLVFHKGGVVTGFVTHLENEPEKKKFTDLAGATTFDSNTMKTFLDTFYNSINPALHSKDDTLKDLGDFQTNYTLIYHDKYNEKRVNNLEVAFFTRGEIGVFLVNQYYTYYEGDKILSEVAHSLDSRISATLQSGLPLTKSDSDEQTDFSWLTPKETEFQDTPGMKQISLEELGIEELQPEIGEMVYDNFYVFQDEKGPKTLIGYNIILNSLDEIGMFDLLVANADDLLESFAVSVGGDNLRDYLPMVTNSGEIHKGVALVADLNGQPTHFTLILFRNQLVGNFLFVIQPPVPYEYHSQYWKFDGVVNPRIIAAQTDYLINFLFLYNMPSGAEAPILAPGLPSQSG